MPTLLDRFRRLLTVPPAPRGETPPSAAQASPPLVLGGTLIRTLPGRLVLLTSILLIPLIALGQIVDLPVFFSVFRRVLWIGWLAGAAWLLGLVISRNRRAFLWRVRRKLLLSYVFFGFVPVVLVTAFFLAAGVFLYLTVASYVFQESFGDATEDVTQIAEASAVEMGRNPSIAAAGLERRYANLADRFPALSLAIVPASLPSAAVKTGAATAAPPVIVAGAWTHAPPPAGIPIWVLRSSGFTGTLAVPRGTPTGAPQLVVRSVVPTTDGSRMAVVDLPVDAAFIARQHERTGTRIGAVVVTGCAAPVSAPLPASGNRWSIFQETVAFLDCTDWATGQKGRVSISLDAPVSGLYDRLASVNSAQLSASMGGWARLLQLLVLLGVLFLIIQGSAIVMGAVLAKSITSAVHELFVGTERIQQGDFTHRINIESRDQLGDLASSFNRMSASIEHLLHVQREKQRLDDELRIAREIQKSLLPEHPPPMVGIDIADLCEPAREVGGDYYDFFEFSPHELGVLIADVSGKGTSAALYMAELKGMMLALSHTERSPRRLLIDINRLLADHLDNRSFITMTYAVIDLERMTLTMARAGHTPMIVVSNGQSEVIAPEGMVLGLRLPNAETLFERVLEEHTRVLRPGDVVALYTDGITEATDRAGDMFGDVSLARLLASQHDLTAAGLRERIVREVKSFVGDAEPHDDMTMVLMKIGGRPA